MQPLVSVVIPLYNCERYIEQTLASVLAQRYPRLEVIVVDDGSTDASAEVVRRCAPQVRLLQQTNAGVAAARNAGLQAAQGEYIAFVDADDIWHPDKLALQVQFLAARPDYAACFCRWHVWHADNEHAPWPAGFPEALGDPNNDASATDFDGWLYEDLLLDCIILTSTLMIRSLCAKQAGLFDQSLKVGEDYDYWLRLSRLGKIAKLRLTGTLYRQNQSSLTAKPKARNDELWVLEQALSRWGGGKLMAQSLPGPQLRERLRRLEENFAYGHYHAGDHARGKALYRKLYGKSWRSLSYLRYALGLVPRRAHGR